MGTHISKAGIQPWHCDILGWIKLCCRDTVVHWRTVQQHVGVNPLDFSSTASPRNVITHCQTSHGCKIAPDYHCYQETVSGWDLWPCKVTISCNSASCVFRGCPSGLTIPKLTRLSSSQLRRGSRLGAAHPKLTGRQRQNRDIGYVTLTHVSNSCASKGTSCSVWALYFRSSPQERTK